MFCAAARTERHRELLRAVVDDDVIRVMLPNVKVAAPGLAQVRRQTDRDGRTDTDRDGQTDRDRDGQAETDR